MKYILICRSNNTNFVYSSTSLLNSVPFIIQHTPAFREFQSFEKLDTARNSEFCRQVKFTSWVQYFTIYRTKLTFNDPVKGSFWKKKKKKHCGKKKRLLVIIIFSCSHNVFYPSKKYY